MSGKTDQVEINSEVAPEIIPAATQDNAATPQSPATPDPIPTTKPCPYCAKTLDIRAVTCRYCGRDLYSQNAMKIVLTSEEWDTNVPQWMIDAEDKMLARKKLLKRIRKQSWRVVAGVIAMGVCLIVWRLLTAPPEPHQQLLSVRNSQRVNHPTPMPTATPAPIAPSLSQSTVASVFGGDINPRGGNAIDEQDDKFPYSPEPTASPEPSVETPAQETDVAQNISTPESNSVGHNAEYEIHINAEDMATEFEEARTFADEKYLGQMVNISGQLKTIDTTTKIPYVIFSTGKRNPIKCLLKPEARKQLVRIKPGRMVVVRGKCDGAFLDIIISDCEFLF